MSSSPRQISRTGEVSASRATRSVFSIASASFPALLALFFWPSLQSAFLLPKVALLVVGSALLLAAAICTRVPLPRARTDIQRGFVRAAGALLLIALISAAFSQRKELAPQVLLFVAAGPALMAATSVLLRERSGWLIRGIAVSNASVALIALANRFGFDVFRPFGLQANYSGGRMQIAATLGNPNFVASFLAASAPALVFLSFKREPTAWLWRAALALTFAATWCTGSRLGIAALAMATIVPLLFRANRRWIACALVAVFAVAVVSVNRENPRSFSAAAAGRRMIRRAALVDGWRFVGDGPGTFAYLYAARLGTWFRYHNDPSALRFADIQTHAHNDFIELFDETGLLGVIALTGVLVFGLVALFHKRQSCDHASYAFAGVLAIIVTSFFDFPLHRAEMWALLWLWMSFLFLQDPILGSQPKRSSVLVAVLAVPISCFSILPAIASHYVHEGLAYEAQSSDRQATAEYARALRFDRTSPDATFYLARAEANAGDPQTALEQSQIAQHWVDEPALYELRARILAQTGQNERALATLHDALRRFPYARDLVATELELTAPAQK